MNKDQVVASGRHLVSVVGAILAFCGSLGWLNATQIDSLNTVVNDLAIAVGVLMPIVSGLYASWSASSIAQAQAVTNAGMTVVAPPKIADAMPDNARVLSSADVKVVSK